MPTLSASRTTLAIAFFLVVFIPFAVQAHGGVKQTTADAIVTLYQEPLSPLSGEEVKTSFRFSDKSGKHLEKLPVQLKLIDTFAGDASKDKILMTKQFITDANGLVSLNYSFSKPNYYDYEWHFDQNQQEQEAGFLVQVRAAAQPQPDWLWYGLIALAGLFGAGAATAWHQRRKR